MQHATQGLVDDFRTVEIALQEDFLPDLFLGMEANMPIWAITEFPVKYLDLEIPNPNLTSHWNWTESCVVTRHLEVAQCGGVKFQ